MPYRFLVWRSARRTTSQIQLSMLPIFAPSLALQRDFVVGLLIYASTFVSTRYHFVQSYVHGRGIGARLSILEMNMAHDYLHVWSGKQCARPWLWFYRGSFALSKAPHKLQVVAPKRAALAEANKKLNDANKKLESIRARVKELNDRVANLEDSLMKVSPCWRDSLMWYMKLRI